MYESIINNIYIYLIITTTSISIHDVLLHTLLLEYSLCPCEARYSISIIY